MLRKYKMTLLVTLLTAPSAAGQDPGVAGDETTSHSRVTQSSGEGVFIRHWRWQVAPASVNQFEEVLRFCSSTAIAADIRPGLVYREPPARYWMVEIRPGREDFVAADTLEELVHALATAAGPEAVADAKRLLADLDYQTDWVVIGRQHSGWSTVDGMSTSTHPMARLVDFRIRSDREDNFNHAMAAYARFLTERGYALPIESFIITDADPARAWMVIFPTDWVSFHASDSLELFTASLSPEAAAEFSALAEALAETVSSIDHHDASFAANLSGVADE